ncbi:MAG TPA: hypothetical protein DCR64_05080 [Vibrio sp.]|nr:hypothetical protein [Vibrio sp.]
MELNKCYEAVTSARKLGSINKNWQQTANSKQQSAISNQQSAIRFTKLSPEFNCEVRHSPVPSS